jgi:hypothetical protein
MMIPVTLKRLIGNHATLQPMLRTFALLLATYTVNASAQEITLQIDLSKPGEPLNIDHMALGQGGLSEDSIWGDRIPEIRALHPKLIRLFIQEYYHLMPEAEHYDWAKLDRAVDDITATGATPLMNIDFKPATLYHTVDENITDPTDYAQWKKLISGMVLHYKERGSKITYWEVANEPDIGEKGGCPYKFTPDGYVRYYKETVAAIREADPEAKVGGPALADPNSDILPAFLSACQKDKLPLDFVSWHIYNSDPMKIRATIERKKQQLQPFNQLHPELILNEWNMALSNKDRDPRFQPAFVAETIWQMIDAGLNYSCYYHIRDYHVRLEEFKKFMSPRGAADMAWWWNRKPQYDGLFDYQNQVRPAYFTYLLLARLTGQRIDASSSDKRVHAFVTWDSEIRKYSILFWNFSPEQAQIKLQISGVPSRTTAAPEHLDPTANSADENIRLKPLDVVRLSEGSGEYPVTLEPYGIYFWELDSKSED